MKKIIRYLKPLKVRIGLGIMSLICFGFGSLFLLLSTFKSNSQTTVPVMAELTEMDQKEKDPYQKAAKEKDQSSMYEVLKKRKKPEREKQITPVFSFEQSEAIAAKDSSRVGEDLKKIPEKSKPSKENEQTKRYERPPTKSKSLNKASSWKENKKTSIASEPNIVDLSAYTKPTEAETPPSIEEIKTIEKTSNDIFNYSTKSNKSGNLEGTSSFEKQWLRAEIVEQTKVSSQGLSDVKIRLLETASIGNKRFAKGSICLAQASIKSNKVSINVHSIKDLQNRQSVDVLLAVYDVDKTEGIEFDRTAQREKGRIIQDITSDVARELPGGRVVNRLIRSSSRNTNITLERGQLIYLKIEG